MCNNAVENNEENEREQKSVSGNVNQKLKVRQAILVEGKYDKIKLNSIVDGLIIETNGFSIFKNKERLNWIRKLAKERGVIILTDSDGAGFKIRHYLGGALPKEQVVHVYIPDLFGKEKRKVKASGEGKLGVEGIPVNMLIEAFRKAGVIVQPLCGQQESILKVTRADLFEDKLTGGENSSMYRKRLLKYLDLPEHLSLTQMLEMINTYLTFDGYKQAVETIKKEVKTVDKNPKD